MKSEIRSPLNPKRHMFILFSVISIILIIGGYVYYTIEKNSIRTQTYVGLKAVANVKNVQISQWYHDELTDAQIIGRDILMRERILEWLNTNSKNIRSRIQKHFLSLCLQHDYANIILVSGAGIPFFAAYEDNSQIDSIAVDFINQASIIKTALTTDLYRSRINGNIFIDFISPVLDDNDVPVAFLVFRVDPYEQLYPLIEFWPTSSETSETYIVRQEGDDLLILNELRHKKDSALSVTVPVTQIDIPAVQAFMDYNGIFQGKDYRGVDILSHVAPISDTPWYLVAQVDMKEIYSEIYMSIGTIVAIDVIMIALFGMGLMWVYNARQKNIYRELLNHEKMLSESREKIDMLLKAVEKTADLIFITDKNGVYEYVNPSFEQLTGYKKEEVVGKTPRILKSGEQSDSFYRELWGTILAGKVFRSEIVNKKKNGELLIEEQTITPITDEDGNIYHFVSTSKDISERKEAELERKRLEEKLSHAQKMESLGTLAGGIAHDFNNILGIIIGHTSLLRSYKEKPDKQDRSIKAIETASERGASLVKQLLTFARKEDVLFESININDVVSDINKLIYETFPKNIVIKVELKNDLPVISGDYTQIYQVVLNLCVNARDSMPGGGTLSLVTTTVNGISLYTPHRETMDGEYVLIRMDDTGVGMDKMTMKKIFEPFYTTKEKGTGLGLSLVYSIVENHNGFVDVSSEPGNGTSFKIYFPAYTIGGSDK